ncbi:MAG: TonB-dependent receptor [Prevotella sp.]|uniref:TonB-dependent receptor n=1 Tax=Prevotella sp. TaxID=59823 RepID=UPI00257AC43A|nr:TonB-dependent receptor [Prevotella sp.]MBS5875798.1 TonB-dependent receptor [Prevotella sp.]
MKKAIFALMAMAAWAQGTYAQNTLKATVKEAEDGETLIGVTAKVNGTGITAVSDADGNITIDGIPDGPQSVTFSYIGYEDKTEKLTFPLAADATLTVTMSEDEEELDEVVVQTTRGTRSIRNVPTRIEFISGEELDEKSSMKPGDIRMLLNESTGISTQQTSAISGNAAIRIQGLDGRYTQILKDGFPTFAGAASGLGLLQTPPLDLKQVEIIKGSSSTLYGGGAIAGLVNLISKTPEEERELSFLLNGTSGKGLDASAFYSQRFGKVGTTMLFSYNRNWAYDPSDTGFTAIPEFDRFTFNPKLFLYFSENTEMNIAVNTMFEKRLGGDIEYVEGRGDETHAYFERNKTQRHSLQATLTHKFDDRNRLTAKASGTYYDRVMEVPSYKFDGSQVSTFAEAAFAQTGKKHEWVAGLNLWTEEFNEKHAGTVGKRDYTQTVAGAFAQGTWAAARWLDVEAGLRADHVWDYGWAVLPRLSALFKVTEGLSSRLSGGFGYKAPTIFTEDTERIQYAGVMPISPENNKLERSYGANWDINYVTSLFGGEVSLALNQLFFYTYIKSPLLMEDAGDNLFRMVNIGGHMDTKGCETNVKLGYKDFHLFLGYTFTDARTHDGDRSHRNYLTPRHRVNAILMYEVEDKWRVGLESYYYSKQNLSDGREGKPYTMFGLMVEKIWEKFSVFANFENFTDRRQTRFDTIYNGTVTHPEFRDIYAPLEGFVFNAGVKIRL